MDFEENEDFTSNGTVSLEVAEKEVGKWLDHKRVKQSTREEKTTKESIEELVGAVMDGDLTLGEDFSWQHHLNFPLGKNEDVKTLSYKPRLGVGTTHRHLEGVKSGDADGRLLAYVAALTNKPKSILKTMDTVDYGIARGIAVFFL